MPTPAFEKLKQVVTGVVAVSDKAVRTAAPIVVRTTESVVSRLRDATTGPAASSASSSPTASGAGTDSGADSGGVEATAPRPTPAAIAKNVAHQRPVAAQPPPTPKPKPSDSPGGKLPPR